MLATLDDKRIDLLSDSLSELKLERDSYDDALFFPPQGDEERELGFFVSMVAIDHRTRTELTDFSAFVEGRRLKGADLLYHLGVEVYKNEDSFTPRWLRELTPEKAQKLLVLRGHLYLGLLHQDLPVKGCWKQGGELLRYSGCRHYRGAS